MPARVVATAGQTARVGIQSDTRLKTRTLRAYVVVDGKRRGLNATFRSGRGNDLVMRFTVRQEQGIYPLLLAQWVDGKALILDRSRLIVRRSRRIWE